MDCCQRCAQCRWHKVSRSQPLATVPPIHSCLNHSSHRDAISPPTLDVARRARPRYGWARSMRRLASSETAATPESGICFWWIDDVCGDRKGGVSLLESSHCAAILPPALDVARRARPRYGWARSTHLLASQKPAARPGSGICFWWIDDVYGDRGGGVSLLASSHRAAISPPALDVARRARPRYFSGGHD